MVSLKNFISEHSTSLLCVSLSILILGGMLAPGYVLTLDMVWADDLSRSWSADGFNNSAPVYFIFTILGLVFPSWMVQKFMLFGLFFSLLYVSHQFLPFIQSNAGRWFAALLYTLNPFVYARMLAGQWGVLFGYACLPFVFYSLNRVVEKRDTKSGLLFGLSLLVVGVFSIHFLYLSLVLSALWLGAHFYRILFLNKEKSLKGFATASLAGLLLFLVVSSYWMVPALSRETPLEVRFDAAHFESFAASENHLTSTPLNLVVLGGFWAEGDEWRYYFLWPQDQPMFWIAAVLILLLIVYGCITLVRDSERRFVGITLLLIGIFAYVTALGAWGGTFHSFNMWFYENIPGWSGLRDSHKIAGVLALVYVTFAGVAIDRLVTLRKEGSAFLQTILPILFILPMLFGMYELFGFRGQLTPVAYPDSWYEVRGVLTSHVPDEKMLILPWQSYFSLPFNNQLLVANPTTRFFGKEQTIAGRAVGMENIYDQEVDVEYRNIDTFLHEVHEKSSDEVTDFLRSHNIRYLFVVVNEGATDQNTWLLPPKTVLDPENTDKQPLSNPKESVVITGLLASPHEKIIDSDVILYHFTY